MKEFEHCSPTRLALEFRPLHEEQGDEFYELNFGRLFVEVYTLAERTFSVTKRPGPVKRAAWLMEYSESFYKYAEALANPDSNAGNWSRLLRDEKERGFLLSAMIMKVLDTQVFSSLLFGADPDQLKILQTTDATYVGAEGFLRSSSRAQLNSLYLKMKTGGVPPMFWEEVDRITTQLVSLLLPAYAYTAGSSDWDLPSIQELYQWLHDVVAHAGWLNVSVRLSPSIVVMEWPSPGERARTEEVNLSPASFEYSRRKAENSSRQSGSSSLSLGWTARVKISVAPKIIRHTRAKSTETGVTSTPGVASYTVMKPHVVYYQGCQMEEEERKLYISLPDYIQQLRDRKKEPPFTAALIIMLIAIIAAWWFREGIQQKV